MSEDKGPTSIARRLSHASLTAVVAFLVMAAGATSSQAEVTLGQLAPGTSPPANCSNPTSYDVLQPTVTSGNGYVATANGVITSWSNNASSDLGQMLEFKVFRQVSGSTYAVVGVDGPRAIVPSTVNTFSGISIPVKPGDVLGLNDGPPSACAFAVPGDQILELSGDINVGDSGTFNTRTNVRLNVTAQLQPTSTFTVKSIARNKKKGKATLTLTVPNPGQITVSGQGVKSATVVAALGDSTVLIAATGKKLKKLRSTGKVTVNATLTFTPTGGDPGSQTTKVKLRRKL
jgi:hypothetical protein